MISYTQFHGGIKMKARFKNKNKKGYSSEDLDTSLYSAFKYSICECVCIHSHPIRLCIHAHKHISCYISTVKKYNVF